MKIKTKHKNIFTWVFCVLILTGCPHLDIPKIDVTLWAGDYERQGITRAQEEKTLACMDPQFDEFVCLTYEDLRTLYNTMLKCKEWDDETSVKNAKKFIDKNPDIHRSLFRKGHRSATLQQMIESTTD